MKIGSIIAVYFLFWVMSLFVVLPWGVKTNDEAGVEKLPGQADSAPHNFNFGRVAIRVTIVATLLFGLFYLNYTYGWIGIDTLDWASPPQS